MSTPDYYAVLGVAEDATDDEIKAAFRALARQHHPDKDAGTTKLGKTFQSITLAYGVLSHPEQRAAYDAERDRDTGRRRRLDPSVVPPGWNTSPPNAAPPPRPKARQAPPQAQQEEPPEWIPVPDVQLRGTGRRPTASTVVGVVALLVTIECMILLTQYVESVIQWYPR